jgi:hypothetical protein
LTNQNSTKTSGFVKQNPLIPKGTAVAVLSDVFISRYDEDNGLPTGLSRSLKGNVQIKLNLTVVGGKYHGHKFMDFLTLATRGGSNFPVSKSLKKIKHIFAFAEMIGLGVEGLPIPLNQIKFNFDRAMLLDSRFFACVVDVWGDRNTIAAVASPSSAVWKTTMKVARPALAGMFIEGAGTAQPKAA